MGAGDTAPTPRPAVLASGQPGWSPALATCTRGSRGNGYHSCGTLGLWVLNCQKKSSIVSPAQGHIITLIPEAGRAADALLNGF